MKRAVLPLALALCLGACQTTPPEDTGWDATVREEEGEKSLELRSRSRRSSGMARVGEWAYKGPLNVAYWPWKVVGRGLRGTVDGVSAGFEDGRMPMFGLLFSPINAATGLVTGMGEGIVKSPGAITPDTDVGSAFGRPTKDPIRVWWYD